MQLQYDLIRIDGVLKKQGKPIQIEMNELVKERKIRWARRCFEIGN